MGNMRIFYNQNNSINMKLSEAREIGRLSQLCFSNPNQSSLLVQKVI